MSHSAARRKKPAARMGKRAVQRSRRLGGESFSEGRMATKVQARPLRLIAAFKLLKALLLLALLATLLRLVHHQPTQTVLRWALVLHVDPHNHYLRTFLATLLGVSPKQWALLTGGTLF